MTDKIRAIMAKAFDTPVESINEHSSQDNIENWDSIHHVKMIVYLEREFDITIPDEDVGNMVSFKLIDLIVRKSYESRI